MIPTFPGNAEVDLNDRRSTAIAHVIVLLIVSRVAAFVILVLVANLQISPSPQYPQVQEGRIVLDSSSLERVQSVFAVGDMEWYRSIAQDGYFGMEYTNLDVQTNWAFFPGFPLLTRVPMMVGMSYLTAALLLSNLSFLVGGLLLYRFVLEHTSPQIAFLSVCLFVAYPFSFYLSLPLPESLLLCLSLAAFLSASRRRWWIAAVSIALASAVKPVGILLLPALACHAWLRKEKGAIVPLLISPAGIVGYALYLWSHTGSAVAFLTAQGAWDRQRSLPWTPVINAFAQLDRVAVAWQFYWAGLAALLIAVAALIPLVRRRWWPLVTYCVLTIAVALSSGSLQSLYRYVAVLFPLFMGLALGARSPRLVTIIVIAFSILQGLILALLAIRVTFVVA